jgi:hypothetical protein
MDTNQDARTQARKDLFTKATAELLKDIETLRPDNGTKREKTGGTKKIKEEKTALENPKTPKPKSMREAIQRALYEDDGRLINELCDAVLVTAINGNVPAMKIVLKLTS